MKAMTGKTSELERVDKGRWKGVLLNVGKTQVLGSKFETTPDALRQLVDTCESPVPILNDDLISEKNVVIGQVTKLELMGDSLLATFEMSDGFERALQREMYFNVAIRTRYRNPQTGQEEGWKLLSVGTTNNPIMLEDSP